MRRIYLLATVVIVSCGDSQHRQPCVQGKYFFLENGEYTELHSFSEGFYIMNWEGGYIEYHQCLQLIEQGDNAGSDVWLTLSDHNDTLLVWNGKEYIIEPLIALLEYKGDEVDYIDELTYRRYLYHLKLEYENATEDTIQLITR